MAITEDPNKLTWDKESDLYRDKDNDPFCPTCYDRDRKRIHLRKDGTSLRCHVCSFYKINDAS